MTEFFRKLSELGINWNGEIPKNRMELLKTIIELAPTATVGFTWYIAKEYLAVGVHRPSRADPKVPSTERQQFAAALLPLAVQWLENGADFAFEISPDCVGIGSHETRWMDGGSRNGIFNLL